jgi:hypothetical protein
MGNVWLELGEQNVEHSGKKTHWLELMMKKQVELMIMENGKY